MRHQVHDLIAPVPGTARQIHSFHFGPEHAEGKVYIQSSLHADELPMIAVMAAYADGTTIIRDAAELKVKESDRIATVTAGLRAMGCDITPTDDGMIIRGGKTLHGAEIDSYLDHRIAMSFAVAALAADGVTSIKDADCVKISYPNFYDDLLGLAK